MIKALMEKGLEESKLSEPCISYKLAEHIVLEMKK
jgi:hypothetical protein